MISFRTRGGPGQSLGLVGRLFLSLFALVFIGVGSGFTVLVAREFLRNLQACRWTRTECVILDSQVEESAKGSGGGQKPYQFRVQYRYTFGGREFTSERAALRATAYDDYSQALRLREKYPADSKGACYVNPAAPDEAVLERGGLWMGLVVLFPLLFVGVGAVILYVAWRAGPGLSGAAPRPLTDRARPVAAARFLGWFFTVWLLFSGGFLYWLTIRPLAMIVAARGWKETPCTIVSSEVRSHSDSDGTTYSVDILYRYNVKGKDYRANRYHFLGGSSSGRSGKAAVVARYRPGAQAVCYVNPSEPTDAVLDRGWTAELWFGAIPLVLALLGVGGLVYAARAKSKEGQATGLEALAGLRPAQAARLPAAGIAACSVADGADQVLLKPKTAPPVKLIGTLIFALIWNGIISVFLAEVIQGWRRGGNPWGQTLFMTPFVLVGLATVGGVIYYALALFNPRPVLRMSPGAVPLGGSLDLRWAFNGRFYLLRSFQMHLEGREEATYQQGTSTSTDREVFLRLDIIKTAIHADMAHGQAQVRIPPDTMHSFQSPNNKIVWALHVRGEIPRWPDLNEEFEIQVTPAGP